ncbi:MAG: hypothetical protein ACLQGU_02400 [bacterium]
MKTKYYVANAITGAVFGFLGYLIFIFSEHRDYQPIWSLITLVVGAIIGISGIIFLKKNSPQICNSSSLSVWTILLINLNLFVGIFLGIGAGLGASYILFIILSAIFGHPENHAWHGGLSQVFLLTALVITCSTVAYFARSSFMYGIRYVERKSKT